MIAVVSIYSNHPTSDCYLLSIIVFALYNTVYLKYIIGSFLITDLKKDYNLSEPPVKLKTLNNPGQRDQIESIGLLYSLSLCSIYNLT